MLLILWYFSGMTRQSSVMALTLCALIFVVIMCAIAFYQKLHLKLKLKEPHDIAFKKIEKNITVSAENTGLLPVNKYRISLSAKYRNSRSAVKRKFSGCAGGKHDKDESDSEFYITAPYCGMIDLQINKAKVYDNLCLFSFSKRIRHSGELMVFPVPKRMNIVMPSSGSQDNLPLSEAVSDKPGDDLSEVRQLREYRPGDLFRHIHHNYSARSGNLWVKEYKKENDHIFDLYLDTSSETPVNAELADAFYEIVYSVAENLCRKEISVNIHWYDRKNKTFIDYRVSNDAECAEMLAKLYLTDTFCTKEEFASEASAADENAMKINISLEWTLGTRPIHRFNIPTVEAELASVPFVIR